jgi:hypothetical protein
MLTPWLGPYSAGRPSRWYVKHCLDFSFVFSAPLLAWRNVFSARLSLFLKSEKIPALLSVGKGLEYRPFRDFRPVPLAYLPAWGTDLKSRKGLFLGPSPLRKALVNEAPVLNFKGSFVVPAQIFFFLCYDHCQQRSMRVLFPAKESLPSLAVCSARWLSVCVHWEGEFSLFRLFRVFLFFFFFFFCCCRSNKHFQKSNMHFEILRKILLFKYSFSKFKYEIQDWSIKILNTKKELFQIRILDLK